MRTIIFLILLYIAYRVLKRVFYKIPHPSEHHDHPPDMGAGGEASPPAEETAQDPVCGSFVPLSTAYTVEEGGGRKYFCSPECRDKYKATVGG